MNNEPVAWLHIQGGYSEASARPLDSDEIKRGWEQIPLYTHPAKTLTDEDLIESLAELEHQQWMKWADTIMQTEKISDGRITRWKDCFVSYAELSEEMKEFDREWARKALAILRKAQEK